MPPTISRRSLLAVATTGAMACPDEFPFFLNGYSAHKSSGTGNDLVALCTELGCPTAIGKACLLALPPSERGLPFLARAIRRHDRAPGEADSSLGTLAQYIRERSRADFHEGNVLPVNGWILALTEARLYALAALLTKTDDSRISTKKPNELISAG